MGDFSTVPGGHGGHHHHHHGDHPWTPGEQEAARQALLKLTGGKPIDFSAHEPLKPLGASGLLAGQGNDTFAGGVHSGFDLHGFASDSVIGGSSAGHTPASDHASSVFHLSNDTINLAGATAAGVKAQDPSQATHGTHTVTLADKTTLNITGVSHDIIKPHH